MPFATVAPSRTVDLSHASTSMYYTSSSVISSFVTSSRLTFNSEMTSNRAPVTSSVIMSEQSKDSLKGSISSSLHLTGDQTEIVLRHTATPSKASGGVDSEEYPSRWPFIAGLVIAAVLLILIVIVIILLIFVAWYRGNGNKFSADATEPDSVLLSAFSRVNKEEQQTHSTISGKSHLTYMVYYVIILQTNNNYISDPKSPGKVVQVPQLLLKSSTTSDELGQVIDANGVYDEPCIVSPISNSSVCSIFSSECHHQPTKAQPYETPLATPFSSRLNLFASTSTLNTNVGSEVVTSKSQLQPQLNPPCTMTLDRLRVVKVKKSPPARPAPLQLPEKEKSPVPEKPSKPRVLTPEQANKSTGAFDERYCTVGQPVRLLGQVRVQEMVCSYVYWWVVGCLVDRVHITLVPYQQMCPPS